jgi:ribonuclease P protein component
VLPAASRLTHRDEFAQVMRRGRRCGRERLVVHVGRFPGSPRPRAGFVVSKAVGGSVVRPETGVVVRALPPAARASSAELSADLDAALRTALRKLTGGPG